MYLSGDKCSYLLHVISLKFYLSAINFYLSSTIGHAICIALFLKVSPAVPYCKLCILKISQIISSSRSTQSNERLFKIKLCLKCPSIRIVHIGTYTVANLRLVLQYMQLYFGVHVYLSQVNTYTKKKLQETKTDACAHLIL